MPRLALLLVFLVWTASAGIRTLSLKDAVDLALKQNPDVLLARLDERKAEQDVRLARAPFVPKVVVGSGLAYSSGFPMSIEGATPSILQANAIGNVFNRQQSYTIGAAKESRRGAAIDASLRQEEVVYRVADLYLETGKAVKIAGLVKREIEALSGVLDSVRARVGEGRELPIEARKAELNLARARYRTLDAEANVTGLGTALAAILGMEPGDQVRPVDAEQPVPEVPDSPEAAIHQALEASKEIRSLESKLVAKGLDVRAERAARLPKLDLVAQYGLLARYNNYEEFFKHFQRHNGQLGISFQLPLLAGPGVDAAAARAESEAAQLRIQVRTARGRIASDTGRAFQDMRRAEAARDVARLDLEVSREQVSVLLAQMQEGRAALRQVEEARGAETDKWIALYEAASNLDKARLALLRQTGTLMAALQ
ncbi:MAG TPA: TolC family protein [Bryobacteraceae bacterium]